MAIQLESAIAANRFGLGARPGELERVGEGRDWLRRQLQGGAPLLADATLNSSRQILEGAAELADERQEMRRADRANAPTTPPPTDEATAQRARQQQLAMRLPRYYRPIYVTEVRARLQNAVGTERPFAERLVHFWSNHFAVSVDKIAVLGLAGAMEREAIRPHVLGRFADMLLAVEKHPAMLTYLDNQQSIGPNSPFASRAGGRGRELGLNENLAREILELHTLGVAGGYTQADVTSLARVITGWSVNGVRGGPLQRAGGPPGEFTFRPQVHEPGVHTVLGKRYAQGDVRQGEAVLADLAASPATAKHLATKLARHFVADDPSPTLVEKLAAAYVGSKGDLPTVYKVLIDAPLSWAVATPKYKTPQDYLLSLYRALELPVPQGQQALGALEMLGQRAFAPGSPAGWPDRSADWDGASALLKRIEYAQAVAQRVGNNRSAAELAPQLLGPALTEATKQGIARAASGVQAMTLLLTSPEFMRR